MVYYDKIIVINIVWQREYSYCCKFISLVEHINDKKENDFTGLIEIAEKISISVTLTENNVPRYREERMYLKNGEE